MKQNNKTIFAGLLGLAAATLLSGCGWFDDGPAPHRQGARPGVDRTMPASNALPPPPANQPHEGGFAPADETRGGPALGSSVSGKGGQKAQKEAAEKQIEEQSKKARERAEREAEMRKAAAPADKAAPGAPPAAAPAPDAAPAAAPAAPPEATPSKD